MHRHFPGHRKINCKLVHVGKCHKRLHPKCRDGSLCPYVLKFQCNYYHPPEHFPSQNPSNTSTKSELPTKTKPTNTERSTNDTTFNTNLIMSQLHPNTGRRLM